VNISPGRIVCDRPIGWFVCILSIFRAFVPVDVCSFLLQNDPQVFPAHELVVDSCVSEYLSLCHLIDFPQQYASACFVG